MQCLWFLRGDLTGAAPETIVPDGRMEIVLHLGEPFVEVDRLGVSRRQEHALAAGQLTAPLRLRPLGFSDVVGIRLRPAAARCLLGIPVHELGNTVTPLALIAPDLVAALTDAVAREESPATRARNIGAALSRRVTREPPPAVRAAVRALGQVNPARVGPLARQLGMSSRTLERRVLAETGLAPATLRRVLRFRRAFSLLDRQPAGEWSRVAVRAGYFDQAHMIREFRRFAGAAPGAFFREDPALSRVFAGGEEPAA